MYNKDGSPSHFDTLSMPHVVRGFTILTYQAKPSIARNMNLVLKEMEDAEYQGCHAILLQQIQLATLPGCLRQSAKGHAASTSGSWPEPRPPCVSPIPHLSSVRGNGLKLSPVPRHALTSRTHAISRRSTPTCFTSANTACQRKTEYVSMLNE